MKSRDVNDFLIATFPADVFNGPRVFIDFRRDIDTNEETEKDPTIRIIMALTIELHHPLLTLRVSVALLAREVTVRYTRILRIISFHIDVETVFSLKDRNRMIK